MRMIREAVHLFTAILGWLVFFWLWRRAAAAGPTESQLNGMVVVACIDAAVTIMTIAWVRWNIGIHKRKGARTKVPPAAHDYTEDALGVKAAIPPSSFPQSRGRLIVIDLVSVEGAPVKTYTCESTVDERGNDL